LRESFVEDRTLSSGFNSPEQALGKRDARSAYRDAISVRQSLVANYPEERAYRHDLTRTLNRLNELSSASGAE
jgi:hypothetical protein